MMDVAKDIVKNRKTPELAYAAEMVEGYALAGIFIGPWESIWKEWEASNFPFGKDKWDKIYKHFGAWIETDENSVHHGAQLPEKGVAVLPCDGFCLLLRQEIIDAGWWDWRWEPVALLAPVP